MSATDAVGWIVSMGLHAAVLVGGLVVSQEAPEPVESTERVVSIALSEPVPVDPPEPEPAAPEEPLTPLDLVPVASDDVGGEDWSSSSPTEPEPEPDPEVEPQAPDPAIEEDPTPDLPEAPASDVEPPVPEVALDDALDAISEAIAELEAEASTSNEVPQNEESTEPERRDPSPADQDGPSSSAAVVELTDNQIRALDLIIDPSDHEAFVEACTNLGIRFLVIEHGSNPTWVLNVSGPELKTVKQMQPAEIAAFSRRAHDLTPDARFRAIRDRATKELGLSSVGARILAAVPAGADRMFIAQERRFLEAQGERAQYLTRLYGRLVRTGNGHTLEILRGR